MYSVSAILLLALMCVTVPEGLYARRLHRGPRKQNGIKVLCGHTLTEVDHRNDGYRRSPHVVDFNVHLKRDILMWSELADDKIKIEKCDILKGTRDIKLTFKGAELDETDFRRGVVFLIEQAEVEMACRQHLPRYSGIDWEDNYLFFRIKNRKNVGLNSLRVWMHIVPGRYAVPTVDMAVHKEEASISQMSVFKNGVMYDNDNVDDEMEDGDDIDMLTRTVAHWSGPNGPQSPALPVASRLSVVDKTFNLTALELKVSADVDVNISKFRLRRLTKLRFEWDTSLTGTFKADFLFLREFIGEKRSGELNRQFIPDWSFNLNVPLLGKMEAGLSVGIDWVTEIKTSPNLRLSFVAKYLEHQHITAQLFPPKFNAENIKHPETGPSASLEVSDDQGLMNNPIKLEGFSGVRPVFGAAIMYKKKKIIFKGWRIKIKDVEKKIEGLLGAEIGVEVQGSSQSAPYKPFNGPGNAIGVCDSCHQVQGTAFFKGKSQTVKTIVKEKVRDEKVVGSNLFNIRLATICLNKQVCL